MFLRGTIRSGTKGRKIATFATTMVALMSVPAILYSFGANPPLGYTGAPGQGTCASCHGTLTSGSGVTVNAPSTYTAGGAAVNMTVTIPATGGFELAILTQTGNAQAGALAAGPPPAGASFPQDAVSTVGTLQYVYSTVETTSWTFSWTPPATSVGNVVVYVTGGNHGTTYSNSSVITAASVTPPATLATSPTSLTFNMSGGVAPPQQSLSVTSGGSPIMTSISVSPTSATWLNVTPAGGNTPVTATVGINGTPAAGTYNANIVITASGASNSPLSVPVTLTVTAAPPPPVPTLNLSSSHLNFTATVGNTAPSQNVMVTASDGSSQTFSAAAAVTTPTGGTWLSVATGTTAETETVSVNTTGLAAGTYNGTVTFTDSGVSNSPVMLPVTLTVNSSTPPPTTSPVSARFVVVDRQSGGTDWLLLNGDASINSTGTLSGSGSFTRFRSGSTRIGGTSTTIVSSGTLKPTSLVSYTPITGTDDGHTITVGGTLVLRVQITTHGVTSPSTGTLTIVSSGTTAGVTLAIDGGSSFAAVGIGTPSLGGGDN